MTKYEILKEAVAKQLASEGQDLQGLESAINKIAEGYLLVEQCIWYRLTNDKAVTNLLVKYQAITQKALPLISKHGFDNLVYTYRSIYTNLYTVKKGEKRWYKLSYESYTEFINKVDNGEIEVLVKPVSQKKKAKKVQPKVEKEKSFILSNFLQEVKPTTKKVAKPKTKFLKNLEEPQPKVEKPKEKVAKPKRKAGTWHEHDVKDSLSHNTFIRVHLKNSETKSFGWFETVKYKVEPYTNEVDNVVLVIRNHRKEMIHINLVDIDQVYRYEKAQ